MKTHLLLVLAGTCVLAAASTASAQNARAQAAINRNNQANAMIQATGQALQDQINQGSDDNSGGDADSADAGNDGGNVAQPTLPAPNAGKPKPKAQAAKKSSSSAKKTSTDETNSKQKKRSSKRATQQSQQNQQSQ